MEMSVFGSSQTKLGMSRELGFCYFKDNCRFFSANIFFAQNLRWTNHGIRFTFRAHQSEPLPYDKHSSSLPRPTSVDSVRLFVGLPQDAVSRGSNTINQARAIAAGLKALKLLGVEGVELPVWWGFVENDARGKYDWSGYLAIAEMVQKLGLKLHVALCFHGSKAPNIPLPRWGITMGLGPDGELKYPSHSHKTHGIGEFQCYDQHMLSFLKQQAEASGNPLWGLGGPHDASTYDQSPNSNSFFRDGGSWESPYGDFFLSWYAEQLITHGDCLLSLAASTFSDTGVRVYGKIPLMHSWYRTQSHPSELTAGFYNTIKRNGYEPVVKMFSRNSCKIILPGMDMSDTCLPHEMLSSPDMLLAQIIESCRKHGVKVSGQNISESGALGGFDQIKKNLCAGNVLDLFIYQRMGARFFSPKHFPSFTEFVRSLNQLQLHLDILPTQEKEIVESPAKGPESSVSMQAA
ncbi:hypothetical protein VNO78_22655 [Psophocarpus tetragonolobus]|uniref:Beta-amylase n=1 Tax=Psophocarpus tetragonolobus TaxID=3891 RepID=A0AAN9S1Z4_PSOTE